MNAKIRLVQTGIDANGRSTIASDELVSSIPMPTGRLLHPLWQCDDPLVSSGASADRGVFPPPGGARFWMFTVRAGEQDSAGLRLHRTATTDLGFVVRGVLTLTLEDATMTDLRAGDAFIQHGTAHSWSNRHDEDAVAVLTVLGGVEPGAS